MTKRPRRPPLHPDFFGTPLFHLGPGARSTDPDTSHAAARRERGTDRARVLIEHSRHPAGLTDFELGDLVGRKQTSAGKRRGELRDHGYIEDSGERRPSDTDSSSIVWRITFAGRQMAETLRSISPTLAAVA